MQHKDIRLFGGRPVYPGRMLPYVEPWPASPPTSKLPGDGVSDFDRALRNARLFGPLEHGEDDEPDDGGDAA